MIRRWDDLEAVLLFGSETWNLTLMAMKQLKGFHILAVYRMARTNRPGEALMASGRIHCRKKVERSWNAHHRGLYRGVEAHNRGLLRQSAYLFFLQGR